MSKSHRRVDWTARNKVDGFWFKGTNDESRRVLLVERRDGKGSGPFRRLALAHRISSFSALIIPSEISPAKRLGRFLGGCFLGGCFLGGCCLSGWGNVGMIEDRQADACSCSARPVFSRPILSLRCVMRGTNEIGSGFALGLCSGSLFRVSVESDLNG
jgi:hypothetical protein